MSFLRDQRTVVTIQPQIHTIDAVKNGGANGQFFNGQMQVHQQFAPSEPSTRPGQHSCYEFWVREFPLFSEYDDATAPIGSKIHHFSDDDSIIDEYACYMKVNSDSWVAITNVARSMGAVAGTIITAASAEDSNKFDLSGLTGVSIARGTVLTIDGNAVTVARDAAITAGLATVFLKSTIAGIVSAGATVTVTSFNMVSTDSCVELEFILATEVILPPLSSSKNSLITIKDLRASGTAAVTVVGAGSDAIEGGTTLTFNAVNESVTLKSNGALWYIVSNVGSVAVS